MPTLIVVFGAGVRADGSASPTLARRIAVSARAAAADPTATLFCSGAVGRHPPSEASVIAATLRKSVDPSRIHLDEASRDTLQSVMAAVAFADARGFDTIVACSDGYHLPRIRMLFRLFGRRCATVTDARSAPMKMRLREAAALPYDLVAGVWAVRRSARRRS